MQIASRGPVRDVWYNASTKFYNPNRGFGFVVLKDDLETEVHIADGALQRAGVSALDPGQKVQVLCKLSSDSRGWTVAELRLGWK